MPKKKILIVDDNVELLEELQEMLINNGYDSASVAESKEVLEQACIIEPDLILLDIRMPQKSGFQVAEVLKQNSKTRHIPIIAMTGYCVEKEQAGLMEFCGIHSCLKKPLNPPDVFFEIERLLGQ